MGSLQSRHLCFLIPTALIPERLGGLTWTSLGAFIERGSLGQKDFGSQFQGGRAGRWGEAWVRERIVNWAGVHFSGFLQEAHLSRLLLASRLGPSPFLFWELFKILYFTDYAITVVPILPPLPPSTKHSLHLRPSPHHCSCPWVMCISFW